MEVIPDYGEHMTLEEWKGSLDCGMITSDDGSGYWATSTHYDDKYDAFDPQPEWATHVMWFNK